MKQLYIGPEIHQFDTFKDFAEEFTLCASDLILTNEYIYKPFIEKLELPCGRIYQEKFGLGEPTDTMTQAILDEAAKGNYDRVIAIGGGTVIDIAKVLVLGGGATVDELYDNMVGLTKRAGSSSSRRPAAPAAR